MPQMSEPRNPLARWAWPLAVLGLFLLRAPHLLGPLDDPHSWRQCDTSFYTWQYVKHGIDLLHPKVSWLGGHGTLIFEFPLPEALAALLGKAFGFSVVWDRVVALAFTALAAWWFHRIARDLAGTTAARIATAVYLLAPISQFYSRAPQVDFAAQAFAQGFLWHAWRSMRGGGWGHAIGAAACGALAAMIKVPYLLPVLPPLALLAIGAGSLTALAGTFVALAGTGAAFLAWRAHVTAVNGAVPDWNWLPGFYKEVNPWWWYVGDWHTRLKPANWLKLAHRVVFELATPLGALQAAAGLLTQSPRRDGGPSPAIFAAAWSVGALAYVAVFFPLNLIHNYYQLPLVAPVALLVGIAIGSQAGHGNKLVRVVSALTFVGIVSLAILTPIKLHWYRVDTLREAAGVVIAQYVPEDELVVVVDHNSEYSDPRTLTRARRSGWPLMKADLTPELEARLVHEGADWVAWIQEPGDSMLVPPAYLEGSRVARVPLRHAERAAGAAGAELDTLHLYRIALPEGAPR